MQFAFVYSASERRTEESGVQCIINVEYNQKSSTSKITVASASQTKDILRLRVDIKRVTLRTAANQMIALRVDENRDTRNCVFG